MKCIGFGAYEDQCSHDAGSPWSDIWCQRCDKLRIAHIDKRFEEIGSKLSGQLPTEAYRDYTDEEIAMMPDGSLVDMACRRCEGLEEHRKIDGEWICTWCNPKLRQAQGGD